MAKRLYQLATTYSGTYSEKDVRDHTVFRRSFGTLEKAIEDATFEANGGFRDWIGVPDWVAHECVIINKETKEVLWSYHE